MKLSLEQLSAVSGGNYRQNLRNRAEIYQDENGMWAVRIVNISSRASSVRYCQNMEDANLLYKRVTTLLPLWEKHLTDYELYHGNKFYKLTGNYLCALYRKR